MTAVPTDPLDGHSPAEAAEAYASLGWRVVPIIPGRKHPGVAAWQQAATDDLGTIRNWYTGLYRGHGIGVACGQRSDVWVLDVDDLSALDELEALIGPLPATVTGVPGSRRGLHLFFQWDPERPVTNGSARNLPAGIDVRGEGGQVVIPPTIHPSGQPYAWAPDGDPWSIGIADAPDALYDLMAATLEAPRAPSAPKPAPSVKNLPMEDDSIAAWARTAYTLPQLLEADGWTISHTRGDDTYWTRPGKDPRQGHSAVLHGDGPLVVFSTEVDRALLDPRCATADGSGYAYSVFGYYAATRHAGDRSEAARALRRERQRAEATHAPPKAQAAQGDAQEDADSEPEREGPGRLVDLTPWLDGSYEPVTPEILPRDDGRHLFYRGQLNWVHGDSGSGKTWLALAAAQHEVATGGHVLWIHYEDPNPAAITERLRLLGLSPAMIAANFHYWDPEGEGLAAQINRILEHADQLDADLVVIDSIGEALNADGRNEDADAEVGPWIVTGPRAIVNAGHTFIGIDHGTKNAQNPLHPSGSKRKRAAITGVGFLVEPVIAPTREAGGLLRIKCAKDRHGTYQQGSIVAMVHVDLDPLTGGVSIAAKAPMSPADQAAADQDRLIRAVVREVERQPGVSANTLCKLLPAASKSKQLAAIGLAVDRGLIANRGTASNMNLHPVDNPAEEAS